MKTAKWLIALVVVMMVAGCEKSDEQKLEDAQKDSAKAVEDATLPTLK